MDLRPSSTLTIEPELILPKNKANADFMYMYLNKYKSKTIPFMQRLWMAPLFPTIVADPKFGAKAEAMRKANVLLQKRVPAGFLTLRKVLDPTDPHFYVSVPMFVFSGTDPSRLFNFVQMFTEKNVADDAHHTTQELPNVDPVRVTQRIISGNRVLDANPSLTSEQRQNLRNCLIQERIVQRGGAMVVFLDFRVSKEEAQQLAATPWLELRAMDLYPLMLQWVQSGFGTRAAVAGQKRMRPAAAAFSLSKVAHTLPKDQTSVARCNEFNLSIDAHGKEMYVPKNLNNILQYEDKFTQACTREGSSDFSLLVLDDESAGLLEQEKDIRTKLPANTPVLVDWLNSRYSYTQAQGNLRVQDISRFRAMDDSHALTILSRRAMISEYIYEFQLMAHAVGYTTPIQFVESDFAVTAAEDGAGLADVQKQRLKEKANEPNEYFKVAFGLYNTLEQQDAVAWIDIAKNGFGLFRPLARWLEGAMNACLQHMQVLNTRYTVSYVTHKLASLVMLVEYTKDVPALRTRANSLREAALNQEITKDYEVEAIPMAEGIPGFLPHQKKIRNLLKDSPDFAILPVQAGGGKTPVIVTDVLLEIKHNRSAPYLIMCPPHLVPQYVSEINHFTKGKLNVIPITSHVVRSQGLERLQSIIKDAPRNTVVVVDYNVLRYKPAGLMSSACYGTSTIELYPVVMFLRQFNFQYVACDEAHWLKNDSARSRASMAFIVDIPKKRLASGTMAHDSPSDLAIQISMLDPTLLGSREEFNARYGEKIRGDRVVEWKGGASNAARMIFHDIKQRVVVAGAMRKEWAAVLPEVIAKYNRVDLTPKQREVYNIILEGVLEKIREAAKNNPALAKFFENRAGENKTTDEDAEDTGNTPEDQKREEDLDEDDGAGLEALLHIHLARLEQFVTAPGKDILGKQMLTGDDLISPKVREVAELIRKYKTGWKERDRDTGVEKSYGPIKGKILIFTNYTESAEAIFEQMPDDLRGSGLLYRASEKIEAGAAFESDDRIDWMVGVSQSMDTGLNLQFCQALLRVETVWNPGTLEQGNARLNRPEFKKNLDRDRIYFHTIVANRTVDVTKASRLISKVITVGKFDNQESSYYDKVPDVEVIRMSLESITEMNDWDEDLMSYMQAYREFNEAQSDDFADYRESQGWPEKMTTEDRAKLIQTFDRCEDPKDAMLMHTPVYVPGGTVPFDSHLGLIRLDHFLRQEEFAITGSMEAGEGGEGEDEEMDEKSAKKEAQIRAFESAAGLPCHTDCGEGVIVRVNLGSLKKVAVAFPDGTFSEAFRMSSVWVPKSAAVKKLKDIRQTVAQSVGLPLTAPTQTPMQDMKTVDENKRLVNKIQKLRKDKVEKVEEKKTKDEISVTLKFIASNGFLGISFEPGEENERASKALQAVGFRPSPAYVRTEVKTGIMLRRLIEAWSEKGFVPDEVVKKGRAGETKSTFFDMYMMLRQKKTKDYLSVYQFVKKADVVNFYRQEFKPSSKPEVIKPYPIFENGRAYVALPMSGQAGTRKAIQVKTPGIRWVHPKPEMTFFGSKVAVGQKIQEILSLGIQIINLKELQKQKQNIINMKVRKAENV